MPAQKTASRKTGSWVQTVMRTSNAMDIPKGLFTGSPQQIAQDLKRQALLSDRTKGTKFRSAMSMLVYYINRAGRSLKPEDRQRLEQAKDELRKVFAEDREH